MGQLALQAVAPGWRSSGLVHWMQVFALVQFAQPPRQERHWEPLR